MAARLARQRTCSSLQSVAVVIALACLLTVSESPSHAVVTILKDSDICRWEDMPQPTGS